jgi:CubicO group peptidase (beta-lactamase class C family)
MSPAATERLLAAMPAVETRFRQRAAQNHAPATAFGLIYQGELIYSLGFGVRELASGAPAGAGTIFRIASMTKSFTAAAILQLRDQGRLRLDDAVSEYVPEVAGWMLPSADSAPLTIRQLLTMSAGFPQDDPWADRQLYQVDEALSAFYRQGATFSSSPGSQFEYSNWGYMLLGRIITNVAGQPALTYISQQLVEPLGMKDTAWSASQLPADRIALPYFWLDEAHQPEELLPSNGDNAAFAGLFTTVPDLARWVAFFLDAWPARDDADSSILKRSSRREMQQVGRHTPPSLAPESLGERPVAVSGGYGFGLTQRHNGRYTVVGHGGGLPGYGSYMCWSPDHQLGIVAMANSRYAGLSQISMELLHWLIAETQPPAHRLAPKVALIEAMVQVNQLVESWDDELADEIFADNFFLDLDRAHWQTQLNELRQKHGALKPAGPIEPENWLRGSWRLEGERGHCSFWLSLTPLVPPRIQQLKINSVGQLSAPMESAARQLEALVNQPSKRGLDQLRARGSNRAELWRRLQLAHLLAGPGHMGAPLSGDGERTATLHWHGTGSDVRVTLTLFEKGRLSEFVFAQRPAVA